MGDYQSTNAEMVTIGSANLVVEDELVDSVHPFCPGCRKCHPPGIWEHDFDRMKLFNAKREPVYDRQMPPGHKNRETRRQARKRARK